MQDGSIGWCSLVALMGLVGACSGDESGQLASEDGIDLTDITLTARSANCADYAENYFSDVMDIKRELAFMGALTISSSGGACTFESNSIPNHDFNDASAMFATDVAEKTARFTVTSSPTAGASPTELSLQYDNAVFLNGVKLDLLAAACYGVGGGPLGEERVGCGDPNIPWRYDPMYAGNDFGTDAHNAHTQPDGTYHYHGDPDALYAENPSEVSPVIGFAADGFPFLGPTLRTTGPFERPFLATRSRPAPGKVKQVRAHFREGRMMEPFAMITSSPMQATSMSATA